MAILQLTAKTAFPRSVVSITGKWNISNLLLNAN